MTTVFSLIPESIRAHFDRDQQRKLEAVMLSGLSLDSRKTKPGDLFFAYPGHNTDGRHYIEQAIAQGASAIFQESSSTEAALDWKGHVPIISIRNLSEQVSGMAVLFYQYPSKNMRIIAVTGTNGKTSITHLLAQAFSLLGEKSAVIGTMGSFTDGGSYDKEWQTTTPDPITLQATLKRFQEEGVRVVAMEASSHALHQSRLKAVPVEIGIFTNLTRDHLDYHENMESYADAKQKLFEMPTIRKGIFNLEDSVGRRLVEHFQKHYAVGGFTLQEESSSFNVPEVRARSIRYLSAGFRCDVETPWGKGVLTSALIGRFNVQNMLAVLSVFGMAGYSLEAILPVLAQLKPIRGRMQLLGGTAGKPLVVIDFSHTPDGLEKALKASREHCRGKLICVFGCGGNRDKGKRPIMGRLAEQLADRVIVTNDNVRHENPVEIVKDILAGCARPDTMRVEYDRKKAIQLAMREAGEGDVVLLAGKGHETYQIVGDQSLPFSEEAVVLEVLN